MSAMIRLFALLALLVPGVALAPSVASAQPIPGAGCPRNASTCTFTATGGGQTVTGSLGTLNKWWAGTRMPDWLASGAGTEASPYTTGDGTAGMQATIDTLANVRGGQMLLGPARFNVTAPTIISTPSMFVNGACMGFNVDPNGEHEGLNCTKIVPAAATNVFDLGKVGDPSELNGLEFQNLYVWGNNKTDGAIAFHGKYSLGQPRFYDLMVGNIEYAMKIDSVFDAAHIDHVSFLNNGYGIYLDGGAQNEFSKLTNSEISDNDYGGYADEGSTGRSRQVNNTYVRNARVLTTNGANVRIKSPYNIVALSNIEAAGNDFTGGTDVLAQGSIYIGNNNFDALNIYKDNYNGSAIDIRGNGTFVVNPLFINNGNGTGSSSGVGAGPDITIEATAHDTVVEALAGACITDSGVNSRLFYARGSLANGINGCGTSGNGGTQGGVVMQNIGLPVLSLRGVGNAFYGSFLELDASALTAGTAWRIGSTSSNAGEGSKKLVFIDQTGGSGTDTMVMDGVNHRVRFGGNTAPSYTVDVTGDANVSGVFRVGTAAGLSVTTTVRASGGAADCTLIFTGGIKTGGSC